MIEEPMLKKKVKNNKNYGILAIMLVAITLIGGVYAFFQYYREGDETSKLLAGDVYLHYVDGESAFEEGIILRNAFPETDEEAREREDNILNFTIKGVNTTSNKDIYYEIKLLNGKEVNGKKRLNDKDIKFDLIETTNGNPVTILNGVSFDTINNTKIWVNTINRNNSNEIIREYQLRMWISDEVTISDTDINATYTTGEYFNSYASVKVSVFGDFKEKIAIDYNDTENPVCTFTGTDNVSILEVDTITYDLTCTDVNGLSDNEITINDLSVSNSEVMTIQDIEKVNSSYTTVQYRLTLILNKSGSSTLSMNDNVITDNVNNNNLFSTSNIINIKWGEFYSNLETSLASYLLPDDGDARILSGGGGYGYDFNGNYTDTTDENFKNYVWYSGKLWRIVALNNDGSIKLVTQKNMTTIDWGANTTFYSDDGEGNITKSWMYEWLNEDFLDTLYNKENIVKLDSEWDVTMTEETTKPTSPTKITASVGLLTVYEYTQSYSETGSYSTGYLNNGYEWWLLTPSDSSYVQCVGISGHLSSASPSSFACGARPSINLSSNIKTSGGDGSLENPYTLEGDISDPTNNVTKLNERVSGEYVNFNGEKYRIVSIENGITKITKADFIRNADGTYTTKYFLTSEKYGGGTSSDYWDYYLNNDWYNSLATSPVNYKGMIVEGTYYLGWYPGNVSYKQTICDETITGNLAKTINGENSCTRITDESKLYIGKVGLGRVGEMFTSQQGTGYGNSHNMLTITPYSSFSSVFIVWFVRYVGVLDYYMPSSDATGARPSINLSSNIVITDGDGTINRPFEINFG